MQGEEDEDGYNDQEEWDEEEEDEEDEDNEDIEDEEGIDEAEEFVADLTADQGFDIFAPPIGQGAFGGIAGQPGLSGLQPPNQVGLLEASLPH